MIFVFLGLVFMSNTCKEKDCEITSDCFEKRKTIKMQEWSEGIVHEVTAGHFAISPVGNTNQRFGPCNLEDAFKVEGMKVKFCGAEKEIFPQERRASTPFVLGKIEKVE